MPLRLRHGIGVPDAFGELRRMQEEMAHLQGERRSPFWPSRFGPTSEFPPLNVWTGEHDLLLVAEVPGVLPNDLDITVHGNTLVLKGERALDGDAKDAAFHRRERSYGAFARSVTLPFEADPEKIQAECKAGLLKVFVPQPEAQRPKRITVSGA